MKVELAKGIQADLKAPCMVNITDIFVVVSKKSVAQNIVLSSTCILLADNNRQLCYITRVWGTCVYIGEYDKVYDFTLLISHFTLLT